MVRLNGRCSGWPRSSPIAHGNTVLGNGVFIASWPLLIIESCRCSNRRRLARDGLLAVGISRKWVQNWASSPLWGFDFCEIFSWASGTQETANMNLQNGGIVMNNVIFYLLFLLWVNEFCHVRHAAILRLIKLMPFNIPQTSQVLVKPSCRHLL